MARTAAILRALGRALRRDQKSIVAIIGNNFFIVTALVLQNAGAFLYLILGLILLFIGRGRCGGMEGGGMGWGSEVAGLRAMRLR